MNSTFVRVFLGLTAGVPIVSLATAQTTVRASVSSTGTEGNASSLNPAISADGRYVSFEGASTILVPGDTNNYADVFVRDLQSGTTERVSLGIGGAEGDSNSFDAAIANNGSFVVFRSAATNLVAGDTNAAIDVFVRNRTNNSTERVSVSTAGVQGNANNYYPAISPDGRFVVYESLASNLVAGDNNSVIDVFVRDRLMSTTERVSVATNGAEADASCENPSISADGRYVAYHSTATTLVPGVTLGNYQIYVRDRLSGTTELASLSTGGAQGNSFSSLPKISADGRFVTYQSSSTNLVASDTNFSTDIFLRDRLTGTTERVSTSTGGAQANSDSYAPAISGDGRFVAFPSGATNLVTGDTNASQDIFVHDRTSGTTERVSLSTGGAESNDHCYLPALSADGRMIAFEAPATNLVANDTNGSSDIFARDRGTLAPASFCFGDGTGTACPCGNGAAGNGCPSSVNASGAHLAGSGAASVASDTFVVTGTGMPNSTALYFQGTTQVNGGLGAVFGDGLRCAGGTIVRLGIETNTGGASHYPSGADLAISIKGLISAGNVRTYQVWYRNAAAFCTPATFNLTNGLQVTWSS